MNYCTSCLRELNGVLSCPGCGTSVDSMPRTRTSPPGVWVRQVGGAGRERDSLPTSANRKHGAEAVDSAGTAAGSSRARPLARAHAAPSSVLFGGDASAEPEFVQGSGSAAETRYGQRGRHSHRRRSLARRVTATGGFAGIAVIGSLALSNLSTPSRDTATPIGSAAIASTLPQSNHDATASSGTSSGTQAQTLSGNGSSSAAARNSTTTAATSASPASSTSQTLSETSNYSPRHAAQSAAPAAATTGAQPAPSATQSTTTPASSAPSSAPTSAPATPSSVPSSASPSPTQSNGICILILCL